jgi:hypothetical protein
MQETPPRGSNVALTIVRRACHERTDYHVSFAPSPFVAAAVAVFLVLLCGAAARLANAAPTSVTAAVPLRRASRSEIARLLLSPAGFVTEGDGLVAFSPNGTPLPSAALLPPGIVSLAPDDAARVLRVQGTPAGVAALRDMVRLLDVPRAPVRLRVRLLREQELSAHGGFIQALATAQATTGNGVPVPITLRTNARSFGNVIAMVSPRINGDGSITLSVDLRVVDPASQQGATLRFLQVQRRVRPGETATFGVLDVPAGEGSNAKPARVLLEITPEKMGPSPGRA